MSDAAPSRMSGLIEATPNAGWIVVGGRVHLPATLLAVTGVAAAAFGLWWVIAYPYPTAAWAPVADPVSMGAFATLMRVAAALLVGVGVAFAVSGHPRIGGSLLLTAVALPWAVLAFVMARVVDPATGDGDPSTVAFSPFGALVLLASAVLLFVSARPIPRAEAASAAPVEDVMPGDNPQIDVDWKADDGGPLSFTDGEDALIRMYAKRRGQPVDGLVDVKGTIDRRVELRRGSAAMHFKMPPEGGRFDFILFENGKPLENGTLVVPLADYRKAAAHEFEAALELSKEKFGLTKSATPRDLIRKMEGQIPQDVIDLWEKAVPALERANWSDGTVTREGVRFLADARKRLAVALGKDPDAVTPDTIAREGEALPQATLTAPPPPSATAMLLRRAAAFPLLAIAAGVLAVLAVASTPGGVAPLTRLLAVATLFLGALAALVASPRGALVTAILATLAGIVLVVFGFRDIAGGGAAVAATSFAALVLALLLVVLWIASAAVTRKPAAPPPAA